MQYNRNANSADIISPLGYGDGNGNGYGYGNGYGNGNGDGGIL